MLSTAVVPRVDGYVGLPAAQPPRRRRVKAIAFYETRLAGGGDAMSGRARGDWHLLAAAVPRFVGHAQPRRPGELGWYGASDRDALRRQARLADMHGIHAFCFRHFADYGSVPGGAAFAAFAEDRSHAFPFCLSWSGVCAGDAHAGGRSSREHDRDRQAQAFIAGAIAHFRDARYVRIDGRPLLVIEAAGMLSADPARTLAQWREACREAGIGEVFVVAAGPSVTIPTAADPRSLGFDAALDLPVPDATHACDLGADLIDPGFRGFACDYRELAARAMRRPAPAHPEFRGVIAGWDDEPRRPGAGRVCLHASAQAYRDWLDAAVAHAEAHPVAGECVVFVNAWNGWADGACLEPDDREGYARLHATRAVLALPAPLPRVALISHDAHPHGAQYLALNLLREFVRMGVEVELLLQGPGWLEAQFAAQAPLHRLYAMSPAQCATLAEDLRARGFETVIANTTVCGRAIAPFRDAGLRVVALIHELPGLIAHYGLQEALATLAAASERIVMSSRAVRDGLRAMLPDRDLEAKLAMLPQGLFTRNRYRGLADATEPRVRLRDRLGIPHHVAVALSVGYADARKGVDLLARAAVRACAQRPDLNIVWVGHRDPALRADIDALLRNAGIAGRFHFVGLDFDTDDYYAGADVYALASREDPFPSVVLESLAVGTPVVAFAGTGGGADLIDGRAGYAVEAFDTDAYAAALLHVINNPDLRVRLGEAGRALVDRDFCFRRYAFDLLALAGDDTPRVSAVVPNRDYARYLPERIDSIVAQTHPMAETVVLDDASTDNSLEVLRLMRLYSHPEPVVVRNAVASGSVFRQWLSAARRAVGEFVWIAEADDAADPRLIETLVAPMRADTSIVMAYAQSARIDAAGRVVAADYLGYTDDLSTERWRSAYTATGPEEVAHGLAIKNTIPNVSAVLFRREALLEVLEREIEDLQAYRIAGDWAVYLHLLRLGRIHYLPQVLNRHRFHPTSASGSLDPRRHHREVLAAQALAERLYPLSDATRAAAADYAARLKTHFGLDGEA